MSILISAPIRTGKTLYVIKKIFEELNKGRQVYTNIVGINIDGVIAVNSTIDDPYDWRNLPNGSVLVWDEAHEHPAFSEQDLLKNYRIDTTDYDLKKEQINAQEISVTQKKQQIEEVEKRYKRELDRRKEEIRDIGRALLMHGHYGIEIYFITQRVTKLNVDVLASVTTHYVMRRKFGLDRAIIWEFGEAMTTWSKSTAEIALNKRNWSYPKYLYKFYKSSENHQVQKSFPLKYAIFGMVPVAIIAFGTLNAYKTGFFGLFPKQEQQFTAQNQPTQQPNQMQQAISDREIDCTDLNNSHIEKCIAFNQERQNRLNEQINSNTYAIEYDPNDPYSTTANVQYVASAKPVFAGCVKFNGKYQGYSQQGTKLKVSHDDCKRLIEDNDRPFNYYAKEDQNANFNNQVNNQNPIQQTTQQNIPQQVTQANNYVQPGLQARTITGANSL